MVKHLHIILLFLLTIVGGQMAKAQTYDYLVFEQNGLYYLIDDDGNAQIIEGALGAYYIEHNGDLSGWDSDAEHDILPGYRGNVTVPAEVTYQGKEYSVISIFGLDNNPYLTALTVNASLMSLYFYYAPELRSLTLNNTEQLTTVSISQTGLTTFHIPAAVTYAYFSENTSMKSVTVSPGNQAYTSVNGMLAEAPQQYYWPVRYVPEGIEGALVFPEGITHCTNIANCKKVTEVVIPSTFDVYAIRELLNGTADIKVTIGNDNVNMAVIDNDFITNKAKDSVIYIIPSNAEALTIPEGIRYADLSYLASFSYGVKYDENGQGDYDYYNVVLSGCRPHVKTISLPSTFEVKTNSNNPYYYDGLPSYLTQAYELQTITVAGGNPYLASVNGVLMDKNKEIIIAVPANYAGPNAIPDGTTTICPNAFGNNHSLTNVVIPSTVKTIGEFAFHDCVNLKNVSIPQSSITGMGVFSSCISLQGINFPAMSYIPEQSFNNCRSLTSIEIPESVVGIGHDAFNGCKSLTGINLPPYLTVIQYNAFSDCTKLKNISLPNTLTTLGNYVFRNDSSLQALTIPASVTLIGAILTDGCPLIEKITVDPDNKSYCDQDGVIFTANKQSLFYCPSARKGSYEVPQGTITIRTNAFYNASQLTAITFPDGLRVVENYAFVNTDGLKVFDFPASVTSLDYKWFTVGNDGPEQPERRFIFRTDSYMSSRAISELPYNSRVYVHENNFKEFSSYDINSRYYERIVVFCLSKPFAISHSTRYLRGLRFNVIENDLTDMEKNLGNVSVTQQNETGNVKNMQQLADGTWYVKGLKPYQKYDINIGYKVNGNDESMTIPGIMTKDISVSRDYSTTQSTATITRAYIYNAEDTTATATKYELSVAGKTYDMTDLPKHRMTEPIVVTGLNPGTTYNMDFIVTYDDGEKATASKTFSTKGFDARGIDYAVTPTTLRVNIAYTEIDAVPDSIAIILSRNNATQRDTLYAPITRPVFTGLTPGTQYKNNGVYLVSKGKFVGYNISFNNFYNFETLQLALATEQPKIPSQGNAFVEATTNIGDDEGRVGFEWRKYDAPAEMKSMEGYAVVFEGKAQGLLKNLSTSNYYKVRAFYDDTKGTRYYANNGPNNDGWITFDPSEVSHMEAVVHTNGDPTPTNTTVVLVGVVIQGSDDIIEQGFEYWEVLIDDNGNTTRRRICRAPAESEHHTIAVNGQGISVEITGLTPGTDYAFRAYAKTAKGMVYGEERTFRTNGERPSGIEEIAAPSKFDVKASSQSGSLNLTINGQGEKAQVTVASINGKLLFRQSVIADGSTIEVPRMPRGLVIVNVRTTDAEKSLKMIVR